MRPPHQPIGEFGDPDAERVNFSPADAAAARAALGRANARERAANTGRRYFPPTSEPFVSGPQLSPIRDRIDSPRAARWSLFYAHALQGLLAAPLDVRSDEETNGVAALYADEALRLHDARFTAPAKPPDPAR